MDERLKRFIMTGRGYPAAAVVVASAALLLLPLRSALSAPTLMLAFVPVIIILARVFGVGVSTAAAVMSFLLIDFLFLPPYYRLVVGSLPEWIGLLAFLVVALVAGQQTGLLRRREQAAVRRQRELELLNSLSSRIATAASVPEIAGFVVEQATQVLGAARAAIYLPRLDTMPASCVASAGPLATSAGEEAVVSRIIRDARPGGSGSPDSQCTEESRAAQRPAVSVGAEVEETYLPLCTKAGIEGVLHLVFDAEKNAASLVDPFILTALANLVAATLERQRLVESAARADALREADRFRSTLVSSVSHELKTPLAAATATVTGLIGESDFDPGRVSDELHEVAGYLARLDASIADLLDLSRLESDAWRPKFELFELSEVLGTVLSRLPAQKRARVRFSLDDRTGPVCCDFAQLARALMNLVENALDYSPPRSKVVVSTRESGAEVLVAIEDSGPGVSDADKPRVFDKFFRGGGSSAVPGGTGLGLAITREIVRTHRGRVWVEDAEPVGARFVVALPSDPCRREAGDGIA